jgi:dolichol-phosphate mannosyltransferase
LSIITPAFNESSNLPLLYQRLRRTLNGLDLRWEWVVVDDHSADATFEVAAEIARRDERVRVFRFARNFGFHMASRCGLRYAEGNCAVIMASDLQDPPELVPKLLAKWYSGSQIVWAARNQRKGERLTTIGFSRLYYALMRHVVGMKEMPAAGADFFLIDRVVMDALGEFNESNVSTMALITWMGFRQDTITYDKEARVHGRSGWTLEKKLKLALDSVTSFTYLPIRFMSYLGLIVAVAGFLYAAVIVGHAFSGNPVHGWSSLMVVVLVVGGIQMLMMGVLGEYLWRALDESRQRPRYLIEASTEHSANRHTEAIKAKTSDTRSGRPYLEGTT